MMPTLELRNDFSYGRKLNPDGTLAASSRNWKRSYFCLGGLRLGLVALTGAQRGFRVTPAWRWSWRGVEVALGPVKLWAGWMAPQFRAEN